LKKLKLKIGPVRFVGYLTGDNKSSQIKQMLKIGLMDARWTLPNRMDNNPMDWMVTVDGFNMDARQLPLPFQEETSCKGLIHDLPSKKDIQ
jgi:hypothetical protein